MFNLLKAIKGQKWSKPEDDVAQYIRHIAVLVQILDQKIILFQQIALFIYDYDNNHLERSVSPSKQYNRWYRQMRRWYDRFIEYVDRELGVERTAVTDVGRIKKDFENLSINLNVPIDLDEVEKQVLAIISTVKRQKVELENMNESFKRFIGSPTRWKSDYSKYPEVRAKEDEILRDWDAYKKNFSNLLTYFKSELRLVTGTSFSDDVSTWGTQMRAASNELLDFGGELQRFTKQLHELRGDGGDIIVFHAHRVDLSWDFPLKEGKFPRGFFVCTDNPRYATQIKAKQLPSNMPLATDTIKLPLKVFRALFREDPNYGVFGKEESEEAYEHAFVLPVSQYPAFNRYVDWNLIERIS